jgi:hypothetical protein
MFGKCPVWIEFCFTIISARQARRRLHNIDIIYNNCNSWSFYGIFIG